MLVRGVRARHPSPPHSFHAFMSDPILRLVWLKAWHEVPGVWGEGARAGHPLHVPLDSFRCTPCRPLQREVCYGMVRASTLHPNRRLLPGTLPENRHTATL